MHVIKFITSNKKNNFNIISNNYIKSVIVTDYIINNKIITNIFNNKN